MEKLTIEVIIQLLKNFYNNDKDLALVLIGIFGGWIISNVSPTLRHHASNLFSYFGKKFGGRLAFKSIRKSYLNWLIYKTQDLNLTGLIGSGDKPKLEQIFISLRISTEHEKKIKEIEEDNEEIEEDNENIKKAFWKTTLNQYLDALYSLRFLIPPFSFIFKKFKLYYQKRERASKENTIFVSHPFCNFFKISSREGVWGITISSFLAILFIIFPLYSLVWSPNINTIFAFISSIIWSFLIIFGFLLTFLTIKKSFLRPIGHFSKLFVLLFISCFWIIPTILFSKIIMEKIIYESQSPLAIGLGIIIVFLVLLISFLDDYKPKKWKSEKTVAKDIGEILFKNDNIAILGKPGSGKSTISQFLALTFAQEKAGDYKLRRRGILRKRLGMNEWFLPIYIPLREISKFLVDNANEQYDNLIIEAFRQMILPSNLQNVFSDSYILHMLKNKKCIFLLDGLDEVQNSNEFRAVIKEINGLISCYPKNKIIVTSRHSGWRGGIGSSFNLFEIEDLNDEDISRFIDNWYDAIEENRARVLPKDESKAYKTFRKEEASKKADKLKKAMLNTSSIRRIAENPLLLSIICFVHYNKTLPKERLRLYQDCSSLLLVQWDEEKGLAIDDTNLTLARKEEIIQEIAISLHTGKIGEAFGRKEANKDEIIPIVEKKLKEFKMDFSQAESLFQKLIERSGIIVITERYTNRFSFSHLTFQEFYSAKYLYENTSDVFEVISNVSDNFTDAINGWWREVIPLYCLLIKDPTEIIEKLIQGPEDDILQQNLQIAAQCLDESVIIPSLEVREVIISKLLNIRSCGQLDRNHEQLNPKVKKYLIEFSKGPWFYKYAIANKIIHIKTDDEIVYFIKKVMELSHSSDKHLRLISLKSLEILNLKYKISQTLTPKDFNELLNDSDIYIQKVTIKLILNTLQGPLDNNFSIRVFELLENIIHEDKIAKYRRNSKESRDIDFCESLEALIKRSSDKDLIEIKNKINDLMFEFLMNYQASKSLKIKAACLAKSLIQLDKTELIELHKSQLLEALSKGNVNQQIFSTYILSELYGSDKSVIRLILSKLTAPHYKIRIETINSLKKLDLDESTSEQIVACLQKKIQPLSNLKRIMKYIAQLLTGKGQIGLNKIELNNLQSYLSKKSEVSSKSEESKPKIDEFRQTLDEFLKISNKPEMIGHYEGNNLNDENIYDLLESHDVDSNEIAFNLLLEKKMV